MLKSLKKLPAILMMAMILMNATAPVQAFTTSSSTTSEVIVQDTESWTWGSFFGSAGAGGVAGAAVGAGAGSIAGGICAGPGAVVGAGAGAIGGAAYYAGTQAWNAVFGAYVADDAMFSETALN